MREHTQVKQLMTDDSLRLRCWVDPGYGARTGNLTKMIERCETRWSPEDVMRWHSYGEIRQTRPTPRGPLPQGNTGEGAARPTPCGPIRYANGPQGH